MAHARVQDFPDWRYPATVGELKSKPGVGVGYFPLSKGTVAVAHDAGGRLWVRKDTPLVPIAQPSWGREWTVQASSTPDGITLYIPPRARTVITYHPVDHKYTAVGKVAQQPVDPEPEDALPLTTITGVTSARGSGFVPLTRAGRLIGEAQVSWGDGSVTVEFLDTYWRGGTVANAGLVRGFTLGVSVKGTTVAVLEV